MNATGRVAGSRPILPELWDILRRSPLTFIWLAILLATTIIQHSLSPHDLDRVLGARSTNIHHLTSDPLHVLWTSLFWVDGSRWLPYLVMFMVFHVPAERWLGSLRWLIVGLSAHIAATYISEGILAVAIRDGEAKTSMVNTLDVGVSYFLAAITAILTYRIAHPWRWLYLAGVLIVYGYPLFTDLSFTAVGHFTSVLIGLLWYPITVRRTTSLWNPLDTVRAVGVWLRPANRRARRAAHTGG